MNEKEMPAIPAQVLPKKGWQHRLSLLAAVLVCITLVGSLSFVLVMLKGKNANANLGNHHTTAIVQKSTPTPTATPTLTIPAACKDNADLGDEMLCAKGEETILNITRSFAVNGHNPNGSVNGSGTVNITFQRAYADISRLLLVYTINRAPGTDWGGFVTLSTAQGVLGSNGACDVKGFCVQMFDTSGLPAGTTQLQIQTINTAYGASIPLAFTLPFHTASKTVMVKQTVTSTGYTITLDHLVLTESTTIFALTYKAQGGPTMKLQAITINGQRQVIEAGSIGNYASNGRGGLSGNLDLYQVFLDQPGSWTVELSLVNVNPGPTFSPVFTGAFTFTVPA